MSDTPRAAKVRVLVVDDQKNHLFTTALRLREAGFEVEQAMGGEEALLLMAAEPVDVLLTDLKMAPMDGLELLLRVQESSPSTQVIVMTAHGSIESAVEAMRRGALDYVQKPLNMAELLLRIARATEKRELLSEVGALTAQLRERYSMEGIVGNTPVLAELMARVLRAAPTDSTVLITGESGTGKELVARALHANSKRAKRPFMPVNCAAITETLLESELFGHAKGAFTGATRARRGLMEEADGGTLFLDEVGETSLGFQVSLLRAIQEREIRRVGESLPIKVDVRILAATNTDLRQAVAEKRFREDLYYRLNVVPLRVAPLRERRSDIPLLALHFLVRFNEREGTARRLAPDALERLSFHDYPGNVRELQNVVEKAAALAATDQIGVDDIDFERPPAGAARDAGTLAAAVDEAERQAIQAALTRAEGNNEEAARLLGVSTTTLWRKMKRLDVQR